MTVLVTIWHVPQAFVDEYCANIRGTRRSAITMEDVEPSVAAFVVPAADDMDEIYECELRRSYGMHGVTGGGMQQRMQRSA